MDLSKMPRHVAIIMDGNGRWARKQLRNRIYGHEAGVEAVREVISCALKWDIPYLTLYAFSKENWARPEAEINALWYILKRFIASDTRRLVEHGVKVVHIGDREDLPSDVVEAIDRVIAETAAGSKLTLQVALNYGGRQEIVRAARLIAEAVRRGVMTPEEITPDIFSSFLFTPEVPDPDLVIRTSGEYRISNFLLWQIAYAEIYVSELFWPDFREEEFRRAIANYQHRERRFGKTSDQIQEERLSSVV